MLPVIQSQAVDALSPTQSPAAVALSLIQSPAVLNPSLVLSQAVVNPSVILSHFSENQFPIFPNHSVTESQIPVVNSDIVFTKSDSFTVSNPSEIFSPTRLKVSFREVPIEENLSLISSVTVIVLRVFSFATRSASFSA